MKQGVLFEANQTNLLHAWQVQTERMNHIRRLNTIYREKSQTHKNHSFQESESKSYMALHLKNKEKDLERKQKSLQHHIDNENEILRNRLIVATLPKHLKSKVSELYQDKISEIASSTIKDGKGSLVQKKNNHKSESYIKKQEKSKIIEDNAKLFVKLSSMKSDLMERLNIKDHQKKTEQIKDKLEKRSPKKIKMLRSFFKKRNFQYGQSLLPSAGKPIKLESIDNEEQIN